MNPYMLPEEIAFFDKFFTSKMNVFEWGSGYSTLRWAPMVRSWHSIEHDQEWYKKIRTELPPNASLIFCDKNEEYYPSFPKTIDALREIDVFLIDGRRRVECTQFLADRALSGSLVFVHDCIRYPVNTDFDWTVELFPGLEKGNHKGLRMYGKF